MLMVALWAVALSAQDGADDLFQPALAAAEKLVAEARTLYEGGKSSLIVLDEAAFKAEQARLKYLAVQELASGPMQAKAAEGLKTVQQLLKTVREARLLAQTPEPPKPPEPGTPAPPPAVAPPPPPAPETPKKAAVPDATAAKDAEKKVRDALKDDYAKGDSPELAARLLEHGMQEVADLPVRYVLLRDARDVAARSGDGPVAARAVEALAETFDVGDVPLLKLAALGKAAVRARTAEAAVGLAEAFAAVAEELIRLDEPDAAVGALSKAEAAARRALDKALLDRVAERRKAAVAIKAELAALKDRRDPATAGAYACFAKGDWESGLPLLAKAGHAAAGKDLAAGDAPERQIEAGDGWWDLAEKEKSALRKENLRLRAKHWYEKAVDAAAGLAKARTEKRLSEFRKTIDLLAMIDVRRDAYSGTWRKEGARLVGDGGFARVPYAPAQEYDLTFTAEARGREGSLDVGLIGPRGQFALVLDGWGGATSGLHRIDGVGANENETSHRGKVFTPGVRTVVVRMRSAGVTVLVDGRPIVEWKGDPGRLSDNYTEVKDRSCFFVGARQPYVIGRIELVELKGAGRRAR